MRSRASEPFWLVAAGPFALHYDRGRPKPATSTGAVRWLRIAALVAAMASVGAILGAAQTGVTAWGGAGQLYALLGVGSCAGGLLNGAAHARERGVDVSRRRGTSMSS